MFNLSKARTVAGIGILASLMFVSSASSETSFSVAWVPPISDDHIDPALRPVSLFPDSPAIISAAPGEYEAMSFTVFAERALKPVTVKVTSLRNPDGSVLTGATLDIRVVKRWYQSGFSERADKNLRYLRSELLLYDDALVKSENEENYVRVADGEYKRVSNAARHSRRLVMPVADLPVKDATELQPVEIPTGTNKQFWITLSSDEGVAPGTYSAEISLTEDGQEPIIVPLVIELLPIKLVEPLIQTSIYYRGVLDDAMPEGSISAETKSEKQYLAELQNMRAHGIQSPTIYQPYASGKLKRVLQLWEQAGLAPDRMYFLGLNVVSNNDGVIPPTLSRRVKDVIGHAKKAGINEVYFYARDEAIGDALKYQYPFWDEVRRNGGKMMAAGWQSDAGRDGNFDVTGGNEDMFNCLGTPRRSESARWHEQGKLIYSYQNPTGGDELPETFRRNYGLLLWQMNFDGSMPYAYQDAEGRAWYDFDSARNRDLMFAYPTVDKPIDTLQWEGFREGIDDLRYLNTLLGLLKDAQSPEADAASQWIDELKERALGQLDLDRVRATMIGHILALQASNEIDNAAAPANVRISPVATDRSVEVEWETAGRTRGRVMLVDSRGSSQRADSLGLTRQHSVTLQGLADDARYSIRVENISSADSDQQAAVDAAFATSIDMRLVSARANKDGNRVNLSVGVNSDFDSGIAVDWQRSLLGWWRFSDAVDNEVGDESSWRHQADLKGDAHLVTGRYGKGVRLNGEGDFVSASDIEIPENGTASIEGWFKFDHFAMDIRRNISLFSGLYQHASSNHFYFSRTNDFFFVGDVLRPNIWHHIVLTWSGDASTSIVYIDGRQVPITVGGTIDAIPAVRGLTIGRSSGYLGGLISSSKYTFAGDIDEVRIWNRVLSPGEVQAAWSSGRNALLRVNYTYDSRAPADWRVIGANAADQKLQHSKQLISESN